MPGEPFALTFSTAAAASGMQVFLWQADGRRYIRVGLSEHNSYFRLINRAQAASPRTAVGLSTYRLSRHSFIRHPHNVYGGALGPASGDALTQEPRSSPICCSTRLQYGPLYYYNIYKEGNCIRRISTV
jgi:hypothetical protein